MQAQSMLGLQSPRWRSLICSRRLTFGRVADLSFGRVADLAFGRVANLAFGRVADLAFGRVADQEL